MRKEKSGDRYFSLQEIPGAVKIVKPTYNQKKKDKFAGICRICKTPMSYINGTNVIVCTNEKCSGLKKNTDESEEKIFKPIFRLLDDKGIDIAAKLFE